MGAEFDTGVPHLSLMDIVYMTKIIIIIGVLVIGPILWEWWDHVLEVRHFARIVEMMLKYRRN